jgi:hypothetical protein
MRVRWQLHPALVAEKSNAYAHRGVWWCWGGGRVGAGGPCAFFLQPARIDPAESFKMAAGGGSGNVAVSQ